MLPCCNLDSVPWLSAEVIFQVVNDDSFAQVATNSTKIFYVENTSVNLYSICIVPVQPVRDDHAIPIEMIKDLICIVLLPCCED